MAITAGKWSFEVDKEDETIGLVYGPDEMLIAQVVIRQEKLEEGLANGHAIAYVPDLLTDYIKMRGERDQLADLLIEERNK